MVLDVPIKIAPIEVAIFPLTSKEEIKSIAQEIAKELEPFFDIFFDYKGSIGKMYRRMDEIGCPFMITVDFDTPKQKSVTLREKNSMKQIRVKIDELKQTLFKLLNNEMSFEKAGVLVK